VNGISEISLGEINDRKAARSHSTHFQGMLELPTYSYLKS